jgi:hypothetical protein
MGALGIWTYVGKGLDFRLPELVRQIANPPNVTVDADFRPRSCFLQLGQGRQVQKLQDGKDPESRSLLWGDSTHFFPGHKKIFGPRFSASRTMAACPPGWASASRFPLCAAANADCSQKSRDYGPMSRDPATGWLTGSTKDGPVEETLRGFRRSASPESS